MVLFHLMETRVKGDIVILVGNGATSSAVKYI